jgi:hypothetical protein
LKSRFKKTALSRREVMTDLAVELFVAVAV